MLICLLGVGLIVGCADTRKAVSDEQLDCLALALYWEARGDGRRGMTAVGWTVLNRVDSPKFPATPCAVVQQGGENPPCQFSWWCDGKSDRPRNPKSWENARALAEELLRDPPADPTHGALFFHHTNSRPYWAKSMQKTATVGSHVFYR